MCGEVAAGLAHKRGNWRPGGTLWCCSHRCPGYAPPVRKWELAQLAKVGGLPAPAHARLARKVRRYHDAPVAAPARLLRRPAPPSLPTLDGRTWVSKGCRVTGSKIGTGQFASADSRGSSRLGKGAHGSGPWVVRSGFRVDLDNGLSGRFLGSSSPKSPEFRGVRPGLGLRTTWISALCVGSDKQAVGQEAIPRCQRVTSRQADRPELGTISTAAALIDGSLRHGQNVLVILDKVCGTSGSRPRERAARAMAG